jgi:hypothetical protein
VLWYQKKFCYFGGLKTLQRSRIPVELQTGQVWELENSNLHIGLIGKTLVHYKHFKDNAKRAPISLTAKKVLEKYLKENKATLLQ